MVLETVPMTYKEKSVTENPEKEEKFKSVLGDVIVDEQGIERKEYKGEKHWNRISAHMEADEIFKGFLPWEHVKKITKKDEHLKYPHVDIYLKKEEMEDEWEEKKIQIFFNKDAPKGYDEINRFLRHIKLAWNAHLQRHTLKTLSYSYEGGNKVMEPEEEGEDENGEESIRDTEEEEGDNEASEEGEKGGEEEDKKEEGYSNMVDNILEDIG